jgi:hypothetical protein
VARPAKARRAEQDGIMPRGPLRSHASPILAVLDDASRRACFSALATKMRANDRQCGGPRRTLRGRGGCRLDWSYEKGHLASRSARSGAVSGTASNASSSISSSDADSSGSLDTSKRVVGGRPFFRRWACTMDVTTPRRGTSTFWSSCRPSTGKKRASQKTSLRLSRKLGIGPVAPAWRTTVLSGTDDFNFQTSKRMYGASNPGSGGRQ